MCNVFIVIMQNVTLLWKANLAHVLLNSCIYILNYDFEQLDQKGKFQNNPTAT